jgi:hypothetical protein
MIPLLFPSAFSFSFFYTKFIFLGKHHPFSSSFLFSSSFSLSPFCLSLPLLFPATGCYGCLAGSKVIGVPHGCISQYGDLIRCHSGLFRAGDQFPQWSLQRGGGMFHSGLFREGGPSSTAVSPDRRSEFPSGPQFQSASSNNAQWFQDGIMQEIPQCTIVSMRHSFLSREWGGERGYEFQFQCNK